MSGVDRKLAMFPDYQIIDPVLRQMVPTTRPDYSSQRILNELREMNLLLQSQINEMKVRLDVLESFRETNDVL